MLSVEPAFYSAPTARELQVLAAVVLCGNGRSAALALGISPQTVKNHLLTVYRRLGVSGCAQAVALLDDRSPGWRSPMAVRTFRTFDRSADSIAG